MAQPREFKGQNVVYGKDQPQYNPLPAFRDDDGMAVTCWELTREEMDEIIKTGCVYVTQLTFGHPLQPLRVTSNIEDVLSMPG